MILLRKSFKGCTVPNNVHYDVSVTDLMLDIVIYLATFGKFHIPASRKNVCQDKFNVRLLPMTS